MFKGIDGKFHIIYRTYNLINKKEYTDKHSTNDLNDGYYGSGVAINKAVKKYGIENFAIEILRFHHSENEAYIDEMHIVNEEYIERSDTYNLAIGGDGYLLGMVYVRDKDNNLFQVSNTDPRYTSGDLIAVSKGRKFNHTNKREIKKCPHCLLEIDISNLKKYHFDNCKHKPLALFLGNPINRSLIKRKNNLSYKVVCPHCFKIGRQCNMTRYHLNNCKSKPS